MNLAIYITCTRIFLILPILYLINLSAYYSSLLALVLFLLAGLSDYLDGFIARKTDSESSLGALLDLLADKLLVCITLFWLVFLSEEIYLMIPTTIIIARELIVSSLRQFIVEKLGKNPIKVSYIGKSKTTVQFIAISFLIISPWFGSYINISDEVIHYISSEAKTNIRELLGVLNRIIAFGRIHKRVLNINDCKNILKDVFNQINVITIDKIQNAVSNYFNISLTDMLSQRRSRPLARPRQVAMYLSKKMTTRSLPEIGRRFANRDHTTVIHAVKTITKLSESDEEMKKNLIQIKGLLLEN